MYGNHLMHRSYPKQIVQRRLYRRLYVLSSDQFPQRHWPAILKATISVVDKPSHIEAEARKPEVRRATESRHTFTPKNITTIIIIIIIVVKEREKV